jgi:hypothetical protein
MKKNKKRRQTRADRRRDQRSKLFRKHNRRRKERIKQSNFQRCCLPKGPSTPNVDTSLKHVPMMERIVGEVIQALTRKDQR